MEAGAGLTLVASPSLEIELAKLSYILLVLDAYISSLYTRFLCLSIVEMLIPRH
jgi:hypothetical protein